MSTYAHESWILYARFATHFWCSWPLIRGEKYFAESEWRKGGRRHKSERRLYVMELNWSFFLLVLLLSSPSGTNPGSVKGRFVWKSLMIWKMYDNLYERGRFRSVKCCESKRRWVARKRALHRKIEQENDLFLNVWPIFRMEKRIKEGKYEILYAILMIQDKGE